MLRAALVVLSLPLCAPAQDLSETPGPRPNVLLIAVDDLNDWVGALGGHPQARTPRIDALAARGTLFTNAHCQAPACTQSRASLFTGRYPSATGMYFLTPTLDREPTLRATVTMVERFRQAGYETLGVGKVHHGDERRFFERYRGAMGGFGPTPDAKLSYPEGHPLWDWGAFPESDAEMPDHRVADWAIEQLGETRDRPFFLAVGFWRPHVPMYAPATWFAQHPLDAIELPAVRTGDRDDLPAYAKLLTVGHPAPRHEWFVEHQEWPHAVQSYLACTSFVDHQVGRVLDALAAGPHADDTVVVLFSDHGFHLGEKERWAKRSLWEDGTHVPLVVVTPDGAPATCDQPVGLIDLYPTLCELCGIAPVDGLQGRSLVPQLRDPAAPRAGPAITTFGPGNHAARTQQWRYVRYRDGSEELYDHHADPHEWVNLAADPGATSTLGELRAVLDAELRQIAPDGEHALLPGAEQSSGAAAFAAAEAWRTRDDDRRALRADPLFEAFTAPSATARPWLRWWWNGDRITAADIDRELDAMAAAGVGGVEINPIALPPDSAPVGPDPVTWLSPEWNRLVAHAADGARRRGMGTDLIVGSGWPFGGRFLAEDEQIQILRIKRVRLAGGRAHRVTGEQLSDFPKLREGGDFAEHPATRLALLARLRSDPASIDDVEDLTQRVDADGGLALTAWPDDSVLCVGVVQTGFRAVVHGAPGADGPVLDHFDAGAVRKYLDRLADTLGPALGERLGDGLRAMFCDSIELGGANWTDDFDMEFERRRGYALARWLPLILPGAGDAELRPTAQLADRIRRARHDYAQTLAELFVERFVDTFCSWCREQRTLSRYQAYGIPWLYAMLDGYLRPDIPEGDTWIHFPRDSVGPRLDSIRYAVWNKYAASAAHLTGRRLVAAEAMTNLQGVFRATLEDLKQAADLDFVTGVNHSVLHGWNHSPVEAGFPGWIRYGTYFSDQNPWWPQFHLFSDYHARVAAVMQATEATAEVAILGPRADVWADHGLERTPLIRTPPWLFEIWQPFQQNGCTADYVTESIVRDGTTVDGALAFGPARYRLLVVADVETLDPRTADAIARHVAAGGRVALVGRLPQRAASMQDAGAGDARVRDAVAAALDVDPARAARVAAPGPDRIAWADALLARFDVRRPVAILDPDPRLFQIRRRAGAREVFFFANLDRERALTPQLRFASPDRTIWRWDPERAERRPLGTSADQLLLRLGPLESALLVLEPGAEVEPAAPIEVDASELVLDLVGPWRLRLEPIDGTSSTRELAALVDLGKAEDPALRGFSGRVEYRIEVDAAAAARARVLDLGAVHGISEVSVGGRTLGVRWWGRHVYLLGPDPIPGRDGRVEIVVRVTTSAANHVATLDDPTSRRWVRAWSEQGPTRSGLAGPVRLLR